MDTLKKQEKTWTKIVAKVLSVILVITLVLAPFMLVALSMLKTDTVTKVVAEAVSQELNTAQKKKKPVDYILENLPEKLADSNRLEDILRDICGDRSTKEVFEVVMDSDVAEEAIDIYIQDLANSISGSKKRSQLNEKKLKELTEDNMDEIIDIAEELNPELTDKDLTELRSSITQAVEENAAEIIKSIPDSSEMKKELTRNVPGMKMLLKIMVAKNVIIAVAIGLMLLLGAGIFVCQMQNFRGLRKLSVNLFIGGGFNALVCVGLRLLVPLILGEISMPLIASVVKVVLGTLARGMLVWTVVMLLLGGILLATYFILKKPRAKEAPIVTEEV